MKTLNRMIEMLSPCYDGDDTLKANWDFERGAPTREHNGDVLAWFICRELQDTVDPDLDPADQISDALLNLISAERQLDNLIEKLFEEEKKYETPS
jgi:hypothetical protein